MMWSRVALLLCALAVVPSPGSGQEVDVERLKQYIQQRGIQRPVPAAEPVYEDEPQGMVPEPEDDEPQYNQQDESKDEDDGEEQAKEQVMNDEDQVKNVEERSFDDNEGDAPVVRLQSAIVTDVYDRKVVLAERYERPMAKGPSILRRKHHGVLVTLVDGRRYLIRKGDEFGNKTPTTVYEASVMSDAWKRKEKKYIYKSTVADFVQAGGYKYGRFNDNDYAAAMRMMALP